MEKVKAFFKRKNIEISIKRYFIDALGAMAQGLFASLLIGTILKTLGQQAGIDVLVEIGGFALAYCLLRQRCGIFINKNRHPDILRHRQGVSRNRHTTQNQDRLANTAAAKLQSFGNIGCAEKFASEFLSSPSRSSALMRKRSVSISSLPRTNSSKRAQIIFAPSAKCSFAPEM